MWVNVMYEESMDKCSGFSYDLEYISMSRVSKDVKWRNFVVFWGSKFVETIRI